MTLFSSANRTTLVRFELSILIFLQNILKSFCNLLDNVNLKNKKNHRYRPGNMKITNDLTNLTTAILILTVQMFFE
jgi:hypothetical protein